MKRANRNLVCWLVCLFVFLIQRTLENLFSLSLSLSLLKLVRSALYKNWLKSEKSWFIEGFFPRIHFQESHVLFAFTHVVVSMKSSRLTVQVEASTLFPLSLLLWLRKFQMVANCGHSVQLEHTEQYYFLTLILMSSLFHVRLPGRRYFTRLEEYYYWVVFPSGVKNHEQSSPWKQIGQSSFFSFGLFFTCTLLEACFNYILDLKGNCLIK